MSFLQILIDSAEIPEAEYIKFLNQYNFNKINYHIFYEGEEDKSFYNNFIESKISEDIINYYICTGKDNLYKIYSDINWSSFNKHRVLFFTDKDFDEFIGANRVSDENIFVTKTYSIENYLVSSKLFKRVLDEMLNIKDEEVINKLEIKFSNQLGIFAELLIPLTSWLIFVRKNKFNVNFNNIDLSNILRLSDDFEIVKKINSKYCSTFNYLCLSTNSSHPFDFSVIMQIARELKIINNHKVFIRGKFELWFLYIFCKKITTHVIPELNKKIKIENQENKKRKTLCKVHIEIKEQNILSLIAPRVKIPTEIETFLNYNISKVAI